MSMDIDNFSLLAGLLTGVAVALLASFAYKTYQDKKPQILSKNNCKILKLDPEDKDIVKAFTKTNKQRRVDFATGKYSHVENEVKSLQKDADASVEKLSDGLRDLSRITSSIDSSETRGIADVRIKNELTGHLKTLSLVSAQYASRLDLVVRKMYELIFWDSVKTGLSKREVLDNLTTRSKSTSELDTMLEETLKSGTETLSLSDSQFDKTLERYIQPLK